MIVIMKIGGSCLGRKDDIRRTVDIVKENLKERVRPILVLSAFKGVTEELLAQIGNALEGHFNLEEIEKSHYQFIEDLSPSVRTETEKCVRALLEELRKKLSKVSDTLSLSPSERDKIVVYGEKLVTEIVAAYLTDSDFEAKPLWGDSAGIVTDSIFGNGSILNESKNLVKEKLNVSYIPVIAGFFGKDKRGRIVTLGRGSTDYIATFIAAALNCEAVLFKDVDGLMTADPKIVKNTAVIEKINYLDALELAYYGSKVIYEKSLIPPMEAKIPIKITNFHKPAKGTTICTEGVATAISSLSNVVKLDLFGHAEVTNGISSLLSELNAFGINPLLLTKASHHDASLVVRGSETEIAQRAIRKTNNVDIELEKGLGLVTAIGPKVQKKGLGSVSRLLLDKGIDVSTIEQSASRRNLCIVVKGQSVALAAQALHDHFICCCAHETL